MKKSIVMLVLAIFCSGMFASGGAVMLASAEGKGKKSKHRLVKKGGKNGKGNLSRGWAKTKKKGR